MAKYKHNRFDDSVIEVATRKTIPADPNNSDWKEFLEWQAQGGVADPADPEPVESDEDKLARTDGQAARVCDWLLDVLIGNGVLTLQDIPPRERGIYQQRRVWRGLPGQP